MYDQKNYEASTMKIITKAMILVAGLALAACTNPGSFGNGDGSGANGGAGAGVAGSASDPTSTAYFQQSVGDRVLFAVDQYNISPDYVSVLDGQATWLTTNSDYAAKIEGHADEQGTREYNIALSERRANAVREYLISRGVAGDRLTVVPYGKERPIEICSVEACYTKNRRAVTVLSSGLTG
jgi:peptidoglycan-associated lipoprotein